MNATNHRFNKEASPCDMPGLCAILVGGVCDLLNIENYSAKSFSHGNPRKISTSKIECYTVYIYIYIYSVNYKEHRPLTHTYVLYLEW